MRIAFVILRFGHREIISGQFSTGVFASLIATNIAYLMISVPISKVMQKVNISV
jgi:hypothetical protein